MSRRSPPIHLATLRQLLARRLPGQLIIQLTDQCNASCIQCGMRRENSFPRSTIEVDRIRGMLDAAARNGVQAISFTGGEPLMYLKELRQCIDHAASLGIPYIRTGTNGFFFRDPSRRGFLDRVRRVADSLAESALYTFWISLDSASDQVHEENRGLPGMVEGIELGLREFHAHGINTTPA